MLSFTPVSEEEERERKERKSKQAVQTTLLLSPLSNSNNAKTSAKTMHSFTGLPFTAYSKRTKLYPSYSENIYTYLCNIIPLKSLKML